MTADAVDLLPVKQKRQTWRDDDDDEDAAADKDEIIVIGELESRLARQMGSWFTRRPASR